MGSFPGDYPKPQAAYCQCSMDRTPKHRVCLRDLIISSIWLKALLTVIARQNSSERTSWWNAPDEDGTLELPVIGSTYQKSRNLKPWPTISRWTLMCRDLSKPSKICMGYLLWGKGVVESAYGFPRAYLRSRNKAIRFPFLLDVWKVLGSPLIFALEIRRQGQNLQEHIWLATHTAGGHKRSYRKVPA